jgi:phosphate transport system protein
VRTAFAAQLTEIEDGLERGLREVPAGLMLAAATDPAVVDEVAELLAADARRLRQRCRSADTALVALAACQAPVGGDLRLVLGLLQVNHHAALIANQLALIGEQLGEIGPVAALRRTGDRLEQMVVLAGSQLDASVTAFATRRPDALQQIDALDADLDRLNRELFAAACELEAPMHSRAVAMRHVLIARCIERIGDNAVGIARQVGFVVGLPRTPAAAARPNP